MSSNKAPFVASTWQEHQAELERQAAARRAAANRENATKSTGPKTPEGKAASSKNRLAHGLCSSSLIIHGETEAEFDELRQQIHTTFAPVTPEEILLTDQLVEANWRLNRARRVENCALQQINVCTGMNIMRYNRSTNIPPTDMSIATGLAEETHQKALGCILRYVTANERTYRACLKSLQDAIKRRRPQVAVESPAIAEPIVEKPKVAAAGQILYAEAQSEPTIPPASPASAPAYIDRC